jgi:gas vesicle protein
MKIQQFIKSLNDTELNKKGTNDSYVLIPVMAKTRQNIFLNSPSPRFLDLKSGTYYDQINITTPGNELRVNGLGKYWKKNNVNAGDEIIFEKHDKGNSIEYYMNIRTRKNIVVFQCNKKGFEILNIDVLGSMSQNSIELNEVEYNKRVGKLKIEFKSREKKKKNSKEASDFYNILFNEENLLDHYKHDEFIELSNSQTNKFLKKVVVWQELQFLLPDNIMNEKEVKQRKEQIKKIIEKTIENNGYVVGSSVKGGITFLTKNIKDIVPKTSDGSWLQKESFAYEIVYRKGFIQLKFVITPGNEQNRKVLREIAKNIPGGREAKGKDWIVNYIYTIKTNIYSYSSAQDGNIKKLIDKILNENKTQIEFFENEVLNLKDKFQY